jgi:RHS repeat-associated protein
MVRLRLVAKKPLVRGNLGTEKNYLDGILSSCCTRRFSAPRPLNPPPKNMSYTRMPHFGTRLVLVTLQTFCCSSLILLLGAKVALAQVATSTPGVTVRSSVRAVAGGTSDGVHQVVSYSADAPDCGVPSVTVQTLTNPFSEPCLVSINFSVDDDIIIDGQIYQSPGTDFTFHDTDANPCPDANGAHSDQYSRAMAVGEQITLGVRNNFRGQISLSADVYFNTIADPPDDDDTKPCDENTDCQDCSTSQPMARYSIHLMLASLHITDTPISYKSPRGPSTGFMVVYNQREANQPSPFPFSNFGPKWTFNWLSYVTDNPGDQLANAAVYVRGGGTETYTDFNFATQSYAADKQSLAVLVRTSASAYEKRFRDGSKEVFALSDASSSYPRRIFMTSVVDAAGNTTVLTYDSNFRITAITDSLGQATTLTYGLTGDNFKITKVTDPFGRFATFDYTNSQLTKITDPVGIQSQFGYETGTDFINAMTTPYGTTTFARGEGGNSLRWLEATDPLGGKERVEYNNSVTNIPSTEASAPSGVYNANLQFHNTFYWDKKAMGTAPGDYTKAQIIHWLSASDGKVSGIKHSEKRALENRVWYTYGGQSNGGDVGTNALSTQVARVLDDGTTQLWQHEYNSIGKMTKSTDPVGRVTSYVYDTNNIDLLTVYQQRPGGASTDPFGMPADQIASYTYNLLHEPLTVTDAAGKTTTYTYRPDGHGQLQSIQNARAETTTYSYGPVSGVPTDYLASITSPAFNGTSAVTSFTYDSANRVRTVTSSPDNYTVTTNYDNVDRPTKVSYPDGTNQQFQYSQDFGQGIKTILDLTTTIDRRGYTTARHYDANRHMTSMTDPLLRTTTYDWCACGALTRITDPRGKKTRFDRDVQSRVTAKVFGEASPDTTTVSYVYENTTSRLKSMTDANNQVTHYQYFVDDNLQQVSYTDIAGHALNPATPSVTFFYDDPNYNRVTKMHDGTGDTNYSYYTVTATPSLGAGQLQTVDGPLSNDTISYTYDALGRVLSRSINGFASSVIYDSLGRLDTSDNVLGHFSRAYQFDVTPRLETLTYPTGTGQTTKYTYFDNSKDRRLRTLQDIAAGSANVAKSDYIPDAEGEILSWTKQLGGSNAVVSTYTNDMVDQLTRVTNTTTGNSPTSFSYGYDAAGNRTSDSTVASYSINDINEITNTGYTYDLNGNMTADGVRTYEWDAANRLTAINYPTTPPLTSGRTEFTYDGLGRRVKLVEKDSGGSVQRTSNFVWDGMTMVEERDSTGTTVVKRFLPEGVQIPANASPNSKLYYSRDHLGSIRGLTNENGMVLSTLDYDSYGGISRAPVPANDTSGGGPVLTGAVSRLTHGSAGTFDVTLPPSGAPGIEMRNGSGSYTVLLTFDRTIVLDPTAPTTAKIVSGVGTVNGMPSSTPGGNTVTVQLSGVADRQTITLEVDNVKGLATTIPPTLTTRAKVQVAMSVLIGDVNQDGAVTVTDVSLIQAMARRPVDASTFTRDVNANGVIDGNDVSAGESSEVQGASLFPDFAYTGHYYHARSGLYFAPGRVYTPSLGRWLSRDPIGERGGLNLYGYVENNPLSHTDPRGRNPVVVGAAIGTFIEPVGGTIIGAGIGAVVTIIIGAAVYDHVHNGDIQLSASFPPGYWPGDTGAEEWGRRNGVDPREARGRFHGIKQRCRGSKAGDKYGVNPETGDVIDPEGENAGNLGEVKPK